MDPISEHTGVGVTLRRSDVDTDQIIPAVFCKRLTRSGYADGLFAHWRQEPDFPLNDPRAAGASVLVAGHNFGTGSSREHAVWALRDWGFAAVLASSFGDIFLRNAWKNGLMAVTLPAQPLAWFSDQVDADAGFRITVDLLAREVRAADRRFGFPVDERARWLLLGGRDDIDVTLDLHSAIAAHEATRPDWLPRLHPGAVAR